LAFSDDVIVIDSYSKYHCTDRLADRLDGRARRNHPGGGMPGSETLRSASMSPVHFDANFRK